MSCCLFLLLWTAAQFGQSNTGELRLTVTDPSGLPIQGAVELVSEANQLRQNLETDTQGTAVARRLPFGMYHVDVQRDGFATFSGLIEIRSALPTDYHITLSLAPVQAHFDQSSDSSSYSGILSADSIDATLTINLQCLLARLN